MNEIKSCKNDTCGHYVSYCTLNCKGAIWYDSCPKYIIEKSESAWEMFRRLFFIYKQVFIDKIKGFFGHKIKGFFGHKIKGKSTWLILPKILIMKSEQEAIKIMLDIEKELKDVI